MAGSEATLAASADIGGHGDMATLTITVTGSVCRVEDVQMAILALLADWKRSSPLAKSERPCGCQDAG